jgi:hypothetical protein
MPSMAESRRSSTSSSRSDLLSSILMLTRSPFNDQINKSALWGPLYDGRAIVGPIHEEFLAGASLEECLAKLEKDYTEEEAIKMTRTWA